MLSEDFIFFHQYSFTKSPFFLGSHTIVAIFCCSCIYVAYSTTNQIQIELGFQHFKNFSWNIPCSKPALPSSKVEVTIDGIVVFCIKILICFKVLPTAWMGISTEESYWNFSLCQKDCMTLLYPFYEFLWCLILNRVKIS